MSVPPGCVCGTKEVISVGAAGTELFDFSIETTPATETTVDCSQPGPDPRYEVRVSAFIPAEWIRPLLCGDLYKNCGISPILELWKEERIEGDDRDDGRWNPNSTQYRAAARYRVRPKTQSVKLVWEHAHNTEGFARPSWDDGEIDEADRDYDESGEPELDDCYLWHRSYPPAGEGFLAPEPEPIGDHPNAVQFDIEIQASTTAGRIAFDIDSVLTLQMDTYGNWHLSGTHDCYPAYDIYVDGERIYGFTPDTTGCITLLGCLSGLKPPKEVSCVGRLGETNSCSLPQ